MALPSALGPACVGLRVVVRRVVRGETGPTGGPALTDVLGTLEAWGARTLTVRTSEGSVVVVDRADVVSGKPVPPRQPVRLRVSAEEAELRAMGSWPPVESRPLGDWVLRASGGFSARANSALAVGDPGPWEEAVRRVERFYAERGLPAWVQTVEGTESRRRLEEAGWVPARPGEDDTAMLLAGVAHARRQVRGLLPAEPPTVRLGASADDLWLSGDDRARAAGDVARAVLEGPDRVVFPVVESSGVLLAKGRGALSDGDRPGTEPDPWLGITDVWVAPEHRRQGLAVAVLDALLSWAAEAGAATAYLQVRLDNPAALSLYRRLGFTEHHTYRYLRPPS